MRAQDLELIHKCTMENKRKAFKLSTMWHTKRGSLYQLFIKFMFFFHICMRWMEKATSLLTNHIKHNSWFAFINDIINGNSSKCSTFSPYHPPQFMKNCAISRFCVFFFIVVEKKTFVDKANVESFQPREHSSRCVESTMDFKAFYFLLIRVWNSEIGIE